MGMADHNRVELVGNLADDPDLRYLVDGTAVVNGRIGVNSRRFNNTTNEWENKLDGFFSFSIWRDHAENVAESFSKGDLVRVTGKLVQRSYKDKDDVQRWVTEIQADDVTASTRFAQTKVLKIERMRDDPRGPRPTDEREHTPPAPSDDDVPF